MRRAALAAQPCLYRKLELSPGALGGEHLGWAHWSGQAFGKSDRLATAFGHGGVCVGRRAARRRRRLWAGLIGLGGHIVSWVTNSVGTTARAAVVIARRRAGKRGRLVAAARRTIHEQGAGQTTLAQIAAAAGVPVGNVYYYFKTKDELISAVISEYDGAYAVLDGVLSQYENPKARLKALIRTWTAARERIAEYGCPIGSLCSELGKRSDDVSGQAARVLSRLIGVAEAQFFQLGRRDARELAVTLVAAYEGVALIANTLRDPALITAEADRLEYWIDTL